MGRILIIEFNEQNSSVFDKIMKMLKEYSGFIRFLLASMV